tara:strand:- start:432 stop:836 length:405 start_codon:yes stop_codon:yes gene_type:complete
MSTRPENVQNFLKALHGLDLHMTPGTKNRKIDELIQKYREMYGLANWTDEEIEEFIIDIYKLSYKIPPYDESDTDISPDDVVTPPASPISSPEQEPSTGEMGGGSLKFKHKRRKSKKKKKKSKKKKKKSKRNKK